MKSRVAAAMGSLALLLIGTTVSAEPTKEETEGREFAAQLCGQRPETNSTFKGVLTIRFKGKRTELPIAGKISAAETSWQTLYETLPGTNDLPVEKFTVTGRVATPNQYELEQKGSSRMLQPAELFAPFASSDFWLADLGLDFLHWPAQKLLKKGLRRGESCAVLESTNGSTNFPAYSRVVSWVDLDTGGIVHADAYDARGKLLKEFEPKEFKKIHGKWELQEMEIRNAQTGSRTRIEFNLVAK